MTQYLPIIVVSGLLAFLATPLTGLLARRLGMVDQPGLRKAHRLPVPLLGGLAIYAAMSLAFVLFGHRDWLKEGLGILGGATLLFVVGLWDDRYGMPARAKLLAQAAAAVWLVAVGVQVRLTGHWWVDWPITVVWVVGITNAANLMDNMDGLAAGVSAVAAVFFFVLAALEGQGLVASLAAALVGSAMGFLFYNFAPASSFMGDAGALVLGFLLAVLGIKLKFVDNPLGATWMAPIVVLGLPIFDTTLVTVSRLRRGRSVFQGGSDHTSHRLVQLGLSQPRAVLTLYVVAAALGATAIFLTRAAVLTANVMFGVLVGVGLAGLVALERVKPRLAGDPPVLLIPGSRGMAEAVRLALDVSRNATLLLAPRRLGAEVHPGRAEVIDAVAALAEAPAAVRALLEDGLEEAWWQAAPRLNQALRLRGRLLMACEAPAPSLPQPDAAYALAGEPQPEVAAAIRQARIILLGPGDPAGNLVPALVSPGVRAALKAAQERCVWLVPPERVAELEGWLGESIRAEAAVGAADVIQARLLSQAAGRAKTMA